MVDTDFEVFYEFSNVTFVPTEPGDYCKQTSVAEVPVYTATDLRFGL